MTSSIKDKFIHVIQKILLNLSFFAGKLVLTRNKKGRVWVVGTGEVAGITKMIANEFQKVLKEKIKESK